MTESLKFLQIKLPAVTDVTSWNFISKKTGWTLTKHPLHLTFFEFKVHPDILDQVIKWFSDRSLEIEQIARSMKFGVWQIFYKKKFHVANLRPEEINEGIINARRELLNRFFNDFGCFDASQREKDDFPIWLYSSRNQVIFSTSLYHRPEVWYPHVTIAMKFRKLEEKYEGIVGGWTVGVAEASGGMWCEVLDKN